MLYNRNMLKDGTAAPDNPSSLLNLFPSQCIKPVLVMFGKNHFQLMNMT